MRGGESQGRMRTLTIIFAGNEADLWSESRRPLARGGITTRGAPTVWVDHVRIGRAAGPTAYEDDRRCLEFGSVARPPLKRPTRRLEEKRARVAAGRVLSRKARRDAAARDSVNANRLREEIPPGPLQARLAEGKVVRAQVFSCCLPQAAQMPAQNALLKNDISSN